ncbi:MAG TPA: CHRD domain-containing protein [Burkholderiales bacterium]|nr:CHRD domain-containing protein [Burkholderiales bacterium]
MHTATPRSARRSLLVLCGAVALSLGAYAGAVSADDVQVKLSGDQESPPVSTSASGTGTFTVGTDKSVSGKVTTTGMSGTAAHIHEGAPGKNGSVIIPLAKDGDNAWAAPPGAKLSDAQYDAYKAGNLYLNVHSAAHKEGEIRGQLKPPTLKSTK